MSKGFVQQARLVSLAGLLVLHVSVWGAPVLTPVASGALRTRYHVRFDAPVVQVRDGASVIALSGCDQAVEPGLPVVPLYGLTLPVPAGCRLADVQVRPRETHTLSLARPLRHGQIALPLSADPRGLARTPPDPRVYGRDEAFPPSGRPRARLDRRSGRDEVVLTLHPVQYLPRAGKLVSHGVLDVEVTWEEVPLDAGAAAAGGAVTSFLAGQTSGVPLAAARIDYVIVSSSNLLATTPAPWNFEALCAARRAAGFSTAQVSTEWIYANYAGRDNPERIRNFVIEAHRTWGTRYLLLGGTATSPTIIPVRKFRTSFRSGTTTYTDDIPADMYYGCLDGDFNYDGDNYFGELTDGVGGGDVDLAAEVMVGRFPVANAGEVSRLVAKTLTYEAAAASRLTRVGHVGEYVGFGGVADYASSSMEQLRLGGSYDNYATLGFENSAYAALFDTSGTLYDAPGYSFTGSEVIRRFNSGATVFNHLGHGAPRYCFKLNLNDGNDITALAGLTNAVGFLAYSQACDSGRLDDYADCFAEQLVTVPAGAFAAIMNTRYGWGYLNSTDGPSQRYQRRFWDLLLGGQACHLGNANQAAKEALRHQVSSSSGDAMRWCYYEITLFGDPATPFAARIQRLPPTVAHVPLGNQSVTNGQYDVPCELGPVGLYDPASPRLVWHLAGSAEIHTNAMVRTERSLYTGSIPAQPFGTQVAYRLLAGTLAGVTASVPSVGEHTFAVNPPCALTVTGLPTPVGLVVPPYGGNAIAGGAAVAATAPAREITDVGVSQRCLGWAGTGSVPPTGAGNAFGFVITNDSTLTWYWQREFALQHTSSVPPNLCQAVWYAPGSVATSAVAAATVSRMGTVYAFGGWYLDGARQPTAPGRALNPVAGIPMSGPHLAEALYLPSTRDADLNGLADWWEYYYFGTNGVNKLADPDGDGFATVDEYADRADPLDPVSQPAAPIIVHTPLPSPQARPPPFTLSAQISDALSVATATLAWRRNGAAWASANLAGGSGGVYTGAIPAPGEPGDTFDYRIVASDPTGRARTNGPHSVALQYPRIVLESATGRTVVVRSGGVDESRLCVSNRGNALLSWTLARGTYEPVASASPGGWRTNALGQAWVVTAARAASAPHAFYSRLKSAAGTSSPSVHACLESPAYDVGSGARLFFKHWIKSELDTSASGYAFDGGIVEISTNQGASFARLDGPYTHKIHGWTYSPWPNDAPCFAGNGSAGWTEVVFDLSAYAGRQVVLRFHYGADNNTDDEGWYVDDIRVGPVTTPAWPIWATCANGGWVAPAAAGAYVVRSDAALAASRDECLPLHLLSNDPVSPNVYTDWRLRIRDAPVLVNLQAAQTSTNGEGWVTVLLDVADRDGEPADLEFAFGELPDPGWHTPELADPQPAFGGGTLDGETATLRAVATADASGPRTNRLALTWRTRESVPAPLLATGMLLQVRAANAYFAAPPAQTAPFLVDNQAPAVPVLTAYAPVPGIWSANATLSAAWLASSDGNGCGGVRYRYRTGAQPDPTGGLWTAGTQVTAGLPQGTSTWFAVQACDAAGNGSSPAAAGHFWIDSVPPAAVTAQVWVASSACGPYVVGPQATVAWNGFEDVTSGIAGYYALYLTPLGFAAPRYATGSEVIFTVDNLGVTNRFAVFALDRAGNVSPLAFGSARVLHPDSDADCDGFTVGQEETAGTDATRRESALCFTRVQAGDEGAGLVAQVMWNSTPGRFYTLYHSPVLTPPAWTPVAECTRIAGTGATISYSLGGTTAGYFKLVVSDE